jgi:hypothetical protein
VEGVEGLHAFSVEVEPGPKLVTFQAKRAPPVSLSTHALANRATFFAPSNGGGLAPIILYQFVLPIQSLIGQLPAAVRWQVELIPPLQTTRFIVKVERLFARDYSINKVRNAEKGIVVDASQRQYDELIDAKWLDPIASLIAGNDVLRRGVLGDRPDLARSRRVLPVLVANFRTFFGEIPDVEALAKAIAVEWKLPAAPPMLADSLAAFNLEEQKAFMPFPNDCHHFGTPWVA